MNRATKDLFDESTMSFGEHLEALRTHLIRAILGLAVAVIFCLFFGGSVVDFVRMPIDKALRQYSNATLQDDTGMRNWSDYLYDQSGLSVVLGDREKPKPEVSDPEELAIANEVLPPDTLRVKIPIEELQRALGKTNQNFSPVPVETPEKKQLPETNGESNEATAGAEKVDPTSEVPTVSILISSPAFVELHAVVEQSRRAVALKVEEAFMTYVQVAVISGFVLASPWIFYQMWLFVAAGLYPHERRYVHIYGTLSLILFLAGAAFCFYCVFPFVLKFLLSFNSYMQVQPQIRLSEWINFVVMLPMMFGISFQLPLVMLFIERLQIVEADSYVKNRKMAILIISIASMFLTPADPMSMIMMMLPLIGLYELGIVLCRWAPVRSPFAEGAAT